jgi:[pyruvate, water dikinase]-phosphate phosphotransferase / [pyruvate, water dikinase] kinase
MLTAKRTVFFISDGAAITAETLGHSLLTQFNQIIFEQITLPFIDTTAKAERAVNQINLEASQTGLPPIIFSTLINDEIRSIITKSQSKFFDLFEVFIDRLEKELNVVSSHTVGRYHSFVSNSIYDVRIDAVNYALGNDDGISTKNYDKADIIVVGVSRTGKTPTCLYLGMQFGVYAANYPLTEEDILGRSDELPHALIPFRKKLYGLTIKPERLHCIRSERRPHSRYASLHQCQLEIAAAESLFLSECIPHINITTVSVEEIAATVLHACGLQRRVL